MLPQFCKPKTYRSLLLAVPFALVASCSSYNEGDFESRDYEYSTINLTPNIMDTRVYQLTDATCTSVSTVSGNESGTAFVLAGASLLAKELIAYGKAELEARAKYLESDVRLSANAFLIEDWPGSDVPGDSIDGESLCLLIVAGTFASQSQGNTGFSEWLTQSAKLDATKLNNYSLAAPSPRKENQSPFSGLVGKPDFVAEIKITPLIRGGNKQIVHMARPLMVFYPHALHKISSDAVTRDVAIELQFGESKVSLPLDNLKPGSLYRADVLPTRFVATEMPADVMYRNIGITVIEGPDRLPTADVLKALASQDEKILKAINDKLDEIKKERAAQQQPSASQ